MEYLKRILATIGFIFVLGSLTYAVQQQTDINEDQSVEKEKETNADEISNSREKNVADTYRISAINIPEDLNFAGESVPQEDQEVLERIDREFLVNTYWQSNALLLIKRANKYFPIIEPILAKNGVPDDFKYLAVAESGLENVVSRAGATGYWQILKTTGKEYGLEVNANVDERYHIEKSTEVACKYLTKWKDKFGTWTMAAAAYNAGPARIQKHLNTQKVDNYYDLLLGQETSRYIFRILALKEILSNPEKYGFELDEDDLYKHIETFSVEVDTVVKNWVNFANQYGVNYKTLKRHNPWLREPHLNNASRKKYTIEIPIKDSYGARR